MRKGGMTFDEREAFDVPDDIELSAAYDQSKFFESFYNVDSGTEFDDRSTIGHMVTRPASRFHYNAVENGIIRSIAHREPPPYGSQVRLWEFAQTRKGLRLLDVGSGTGHWIDFFVDAHYVGDVVGLEVASNVRKFLIEKYADRPRVEIKDADVSSPDFLASDLGEPFDYISAIGVLFHITDDAGWRQALRNLRSVLSPEGLIFAGGDFGWQTRNVQFHRVDEFDDWAAQTADANAHKAFVNKRVRSLADWHAAAAEADLAILDLVRVETDWAIHTPENDLLVLGPATET